MVSCAHFRESAKGVAFSVCFYLVAFACCGFAGVPPCCVCVVFWWICGRGMCRPAPRLFVLCISLWGDRDVLRCCVHLYEYV